MTEQTGVDEIVTLIYRGATATASWDPALSAIVDFFDASTVCLSVSVRGAKPFEFRFACGPKVSKEVLAEWEKTQRGVNMSPPSLLGVPRVRRYAHECPDDPVAQELLQYGVAFSLSYCFDSSDGNDYVLNVSRGIDDPEFVSGDFEAIKRIGNHFREAVRLRREMVRANLTSQFQAQALDRLGIMGILIDPFGNVMPLSGGAEKMLESMDCLRLRNDRLVAINRSNDKELQQHIRRILSGEVPEGESFAMPLERVDGGRPVGLIISSARSMCLASNREENCALLFLRDNETSFAIETSLVQKLFSFTPAEASLAIGLASGRRLDEIEEQMRIRHNTARAHLRSIFVKAEVTRQAELVCLLTNSVAPLAQRARVLDRVA